MRTVVLLAGAFPRKGGAERAVLDAAGRVVACDGAAAAFRRRTGRWPTAVVGDLDSMRARLPAEVEVVRMPDQDTSDLDKAVRFCRSRGWDDLVIVGATGGRMDHAIGNVFRALAAGVEVVTDDGTFHLVCGRRRLKTRPGAGVSVFADDPRVKVTSRGLVWPLDGVRLNSVAAATLNRAKGSAIALASDRPIFVFIENGPRS